MPVRFSRSGCIWSIVVSVLLTLALNLGLRVCAG